MPGAWNTTNVSARIRLMIWVEGHSSIHFHPLRPPASWDHWQAYLGFQALGSLGKAAIPHLVKLARDPSGNSYMGNVQGMKDIGLVAKLADNSSTYVIAGESPMMGNRSVGTNTFFVTTGRMRATNSYLVDGDIAACSLAAIGTDAVPSLTEMLADPNPRLKERAALALGMTGDAAESAVPGLINCLSHPNVMVRIVAADALGWINQKPDLTVPALTQSLNDPEIGVKCWAADSLGRFRERATNAIPVLLASFAARDYRIRGSAAVALSKISQDTTAKEVVPVLLQQYNQSDSSLRSGAIRDLGQLHMLPEVLIPVFTAALDDSDDLVRMNAIHALEWFGPKAKASVPKLLSLKTDRNPFVCEYAVRALEKINPQP